MEWSHFILCLWLADKQSYVGQATRKDSPCAALDGGKGRAVPCQLDWLRQREQLRRRGSPAVIWEHAMTTCKCLSRLASQAIKCFLSMWDAIWDKWAFLKEREKRIFWKGTLFQFGYRSCTNETTAESAWGKCKTELPLLVQSWRLSYSSECLKDIP